MKKVLATAFVALYALTTFAQAPEYKDLLGMFVDEKYEKVLSKGLGYTENEKTKKDPLPYLFVGMAYFEMSKLDEYKTDYPNAFKDALKYTSKYSAKDKEKAFASEYEDFFAEIRTATMAEAELMMDQEKWTKAKSMYNYLIDFDANDAGAWIMQGIVFSAMKSKKEAEESFQTAFDLLSNRTCSVNTKEQSNLLKNALIAVGMILSEGGAKEKAIEWMDLGMEYFKDDNEYKVTYEMINS